MLINDLRQKLMVYVSGLDIDISKLSGIMVEEPKDKKFGDLSTNAAMVLAPILGKNPMDIAGDLISGAISGWPEADNINIVKPGFINFNIRDDFLKAALVEIVQKKEDFGKNTSGGGIKVQLEYVSSNPTGSLHIGHGRWGALGDSLANIYAANGYEVFREYYVNDHGSQADTFTSCAWSLYLKHFNEECEYPEDGYPEDLVLIAVNRLIAKSGSGFLNAGKEKVNVKTEAFKKETIRIMVSYISETLGSMNVRFDRWFHESSLYEDSNFDKALSRLRDINVLYEKEGALWFRSEKFGDEKDRVVVRSDGNPTYFASDIMYLQDKDRRGYDRMIYILGADHHGYVNRMKAIGKALGIEEKKLAIIIGQLVNIVEDKKAIKMSRRKGKLYTLRDLVKEVGKDAVRYFFCMNSFDTPMDFDIGLAKQKSNQNPVYYVQYAHARIESILGKIKKSRPSNLDPDNFTLDKAALKEVDLKEETDRRLAKLMILYPDTVRSSCKYEAPHIITQYLYRLASEFHFFYNRYRILDETGEEAAVDIDRYILILLVKDVLKNALGLLGVSAPEKM